LQCLPLFFSPCRAAAAGSPIVAIETIVGVSKRAHNIILNYVLVGMYRLFEYMKWPVSVLD